jgi:hypothetical protein
MELRRRPARRRRLSKLFVAVIGVAILIVVSLIGYAYTQPVSTIHIMAGVGTDYGYEDVLIYLDGELVGNKNVTWGHGVFDETFHVVHGRHIVDVLWSHLIGIVSGSKRIIDLDPFETENVFYLYGMGLV